MRKPNDTLPKALDVVVLTQDEARIWHGLPDRERQHGNPTKPQRVAARDPHRVHRHVRTGQAHHMHHLDADDPKYFDAVAAQVGDAERILLVGHARGRSNMAKGFAAHVSKRHRQIAKRVIGEIEADIPALTEPEILELARSWYARYCKRER
ncbi:MAG: hypothetical protein RLZ29_799 [Actinomycetota bacterium]|jgi:hypothetical protein